MQTLYQHQTTFATTSSTKCEYQQIPSYSYLHAAISKKLKKKSSESKSLQYYTYKHQSGYNLAYVNFKYH